jgi:3-oxoacyl-[acyl-carrier protein] reductase
MNIILTGNSGRLGTVLYESLIDGINSVATFSRNNDYLETVNMLKFKGSLNRIEDIELFVKKVIDKWENIDILINSAGIIDMKPISNYSEEDYDFIFNVNVKGTFFMTQMVLKYMKSGGKIINIGSTRAITGAPNKSLYSMSKFALRSLTQCINAEYKDKGISSTIICPGSFDTVPINSVVDAIMLAINTPNEANIPEIVLGGQL